MLDLFRHVNYYLALDTACKDNVTGNTIPDVDIHP